MTDLTGMYWIDRTNFPNSELPPWRQPQMQDRRWRRHRVVSLKVYDIDWAEVPRSAVGNGKTYGLGWRELSG